MNIYLKQRRRSDRKTESPYRPCAPKEKGTEQRKNENPYNANTSVASVLILALTLASRICA